MTINSNRETGSPGRVLVVDDVLANRELLAQELEDEDFVVETAASGQECLDKALSWKPDVILLDIQMPEMDGIECCKRLKAAHDTKDIPVVFLTAKRTDKESTVEALRAGGNDFLPKPYTPEILFARVSCQVSISRAHAALRRMAMHDDLTGLYSRRHLFTSLPGMVRMGTRSGPKSTGCLVVDIDFFKKINDTLGHLEGDRVLKHVAETILKAVRESDLVSRFGGEEFVVILPNTDLEGAQVLAEKVRAAVEDVCKPTTVSVGVAAQALPDPRSPILSSKEQIEELMQDLLRVADEALYEAKRQGRNRVIAREA